ncbi:MAG: hypothetical protein WD733_06020 [Bryobacterales bacterium]
MVVTVTLLACYSFGPVHTLIGNSGFLILIPYFVIVVLTLRAQKHLSAWTSIANFTSLALVGLPLSNIWISTGPPVQLSEFRSPVSSQTAVNAKPLPDIYFVILDGYGRSDVLRSLYGLDNSAFLQQLRQRDFYVAGNSRSNYAQTKLALASTLNLDYLDVLLAGLDPDTLDHRTSRRLIRNNRLVRFLKEHGYSIIEVQSPLYDVAIHDSHRSVRKWWFLNLFEITVADMTPMSWLLEQAGLPGLHELHRRRMAHSIDATEEISSVQGPKFVFLHVFAGHPPFVFGEYGEASNPPRRYSWKSGIDFLSLPAASREEYRIGYRAQVEYINQRMIAMVDTILAHSAISPVIVLQGDHGPASGLNQYDAESTDMNERFAILNAIHMGDGGNESLYDSMSSVNTFRVILNAYLQTDYQPLTDRSYFSTWTQPFEFALLKDDAPQLGNR